MDKPTLEQIAWVFDCLMKNQQEDGTYRHLLEVMGVADNPHAYEKLLAGLDINNAMIACYHPEEADKCSEG